ncbi:hypothetical protein MKW92_023437 [Papaver armeniacum]|nr:hypothetical protein MKW92_023437 [Papaver armeniacum]
MITRQLVVLLLGLVMVRVAVKLRTHAGCCKNLARYMLEHYNCDSYSLILHKTKLFAPALAPFKAYYEGDGFPDVFDLSLLSHVKETSGVPKQSQAQHEMLNMLKPRLFL